MNTEQLQYRIRGQSARAIVASVEDGVTGGHLPPGHALPSVRRLAQDLGVSPTTVAMAYGELRRRGIVVTQQRSGTRVSRRPPLPAREAPPAPPGVRDLATGNPDPALLPPLAPALRGFDPPTRLYGEEMVLAAFADASAGSLAADGIDTSNLAVVNGALDGVERVLDAHLRSGDRVAVEDPCYTGVLDLCRAMGLEPYPVAVDDRGMRPDALATAIEAGAAAVVLTPRAQNPTGAAMDEARAGALAALLANERDLLVVEDDHAAGIAGAPAVTTTRALGRWACIRSLSKALAPDLRVAVLVGDALTVARVEGRQRLGCGWVSHLLQRVAARLWAEARAGNLLERAATTYAVRRQALIDALAAHGIDAHGRSGLNVWVPVPEEVRVVQGLSQRGWAVQAGEPYRLATSPAVRITVAALVEDDARALAADLAATLAPRGRTHAA